MIFFSCLVIQNYSSMFVWFEEWRLEHVHEERNKVASLVATSVTQDLRLQSYVATGAPCWLCHLVLQEASAI